MVHKTLPSSMQHDKSYFISEIKTCIGLYLTVGFEYYQAYLLPSFCMKPPKTALATLCKT